MQINKSTKPGTTSGNVLDACPPPEVLRSNLELRRRFSVLLLTLLTVVLLGISFAPFDCWFVAYFALVPWAMAMAGGVKRWSTVLIGWLGGLLFWAGMVYWLIYPTLPGYLGGTVYLSLYWLVASILVRRAMRRGWGMWIVLPVLWVGLEFLRARMWLLGFPWFFLSQSQYRQTVLIQVADVTGQYGVSFFVAMVNGVLLDLLYGPLFVRLRTRARLSAHIFGGILVTILVLAGLLIYGHYRLRQRPDVTSPGPKVGIVQEAFPLSLQGPHTPPQTFLEAHVQRSMQLIGHGCEVVLWPETMLPPGMNRDMLVTEITRLSDRDVYWLAVREFGPETAGRNDTPTLRKGLQTFWFGAERPESYQAAAVRFVLRHSLKEAQLHQLADEQVRRLASRLLGVTRARAAAPAALRLALLLHLPGPPASWTQADPPTVRRAAELILANPPSPDRNLSALIRRVRKVVVARNAADSERIHTLRGRVCLLETCSILLDCPILTGGATYHRDPHPKIPTAPTWYLRNSVLWFDANGPGETEYAKIVLVPFSEYVPWERSCPSLYRSLRSLVPKLMPQIRPGTDRTRFDLTRGKEHWQLATPICFEGTFARLCRAMVDAGPKNHLLLANLSNDGWFVRQSGQGPPRGSTAHHQHLVHSVFRAVENRVPVLRAVNTGISALVSSDGIIEAVLEIRIEEYRKRTMVAGVLAGKTLVDHRRSLYSLYGDVFAFWSSLSALVITLILLIGRRAYRKES